MTHDNVELQSDPIFATIACHKVASRAVVAACRKTGPYVPGKEPNQLEQARNLAFEAEADARSLMHQTIPQTVPGLAAYVAYWSEYMSTDHWLEETGWEAIPTISAAMAALFPVDRKGVAA